MNNATLIGLIFGGVMSVAGVVLTSLTWRRLHRSGERPNIVFGLWFAAGCFALAAAVIGIFAEIYEPSGSTPWRTTSYGFLSSGGVWSMLAGMTENLFQHPQLPGPPPEAPSLPSDTRSLPPG